MPDGLPAPSSLLSSRWTQDNLVTSDPARLYDGPVRERLTLESVEYLIPELEKKVGPVRAGAARMGVFTWDVGCTGRDGPFVLQVPLVLDGPGRRGRAKSELPRLAVENARHFIDSGLTRFVVEPTALMTLAGDVPAATFAALPDHHPLTFGQGAVQVEPTDESAARQAASGGAAVVALGPAPTADLLAEMVAALVYHYEPDREGGTAVTDVCINDGDFVVKRRRDGSFDLRLTTVRRREPGIGPHLLLLYLIQMMAYEDWMIDGELVGLPVLVSNPSVAFEGLRRGLCYRARDLGGTEDGGTREAERWIHDFGRSRVGRAYRPWVKRFLAGQLPSSFGGDTRERWWRLIPLQKKLGFFELRARQGSGDDAARAESSARALRTFIERLSAEIGHVPEPPPGTIAVNDLGRAGVLDLLSEAGVPEASRHGVADEWMAHWPHRNLSQLLADVPGAVVLRRAKHRIAFGRVIPEAEQGTLASLGPAPKDPGPAQPVANAELFGHLSVPPGLEAEAARTFPTFEAYMDAALHDEKWGYYGHGVSIGTEGHFTTSPESMSPHYGRWLANWAYRCWQAMLARGELTEADLFPVVEFGAGNGRLARDFLDGVARGAGDGPEPASLDPAERRARQVFAGRLQYRIYETSAALRERQRHLLGGAAIVGEGDARQPAAILQRDFPGGLKGLVLTNEVPDAFGVHKVLLRADGDAQVALVVPRMEPSLRETLRQMGGDGLVERVAAADATVRATFGFENDEGDLYLDRDVFGDVMAALWRFAAPQAEALLGRLTFEEAYVPISVVPALAAHMKANAAQYAIALAAESSGVVLYVNVHAARFIRELAGALRAGFIVTIDYGDTTWGLVRGARRGDFPFRVYGEWQDYVPRPNDPYAAPGSQDMTADVNFTDLARAGEDAGLRVLHYGPERDVIGDELPAMMEAGARDPAIAEFLGNPVFKVLVLATHSGDLFGGALLTHLPLSCTEQDVPRPRRPSIAPIAGRLSGSRTD